MRTGHWDSLGMAWWGHGDENHGGWEQRLLVQGLLEGDRQRDGWTEGWREGQMDRQTDRGSPGQGVGLQVLNSRLCRGGPSRVRFL